MLCCGSAGGSPIALDRMTPMGALCQLVGLARVGRDVGMGRDVGHTHT